MEHWTAVHYPELCAGKAKIHIIFVVGIGHSIWMCPVLFLIIHHGGEAGEQPMKLTNRTTGQKRGVSNCMNLR